VGGISSSPVLVVVADNSPYKTLGDLVEDARRHPNKLNIATGGGATLTNLAAEMLRSAAKVNFQSVSYKGTGPLLSAVIGGEVDAAVDLVSSSLALVKGGKLRALAVTSAKRSSVMPNVPTLNEAIKAAPFDVTGWYGLLAPAGTPPALVAQLNREINQALTSPEVVAKLANMGAEPLPGDPEQFNKLLVSETARWTRLIRQLNLKPE
jgi:tripartite-type tricarboxylate transporter receptor subunit TctC